MRRFLSIATTALLAATNASAHFMWIELPGDAPTTAHLRFAEEPAERTNAGMQKKAQPMQVVNQEGDTVTFEIGEEALVAEVSEDTEWLNGSLQYGVLDRNEEGKGTFLLHYYAKSVRTPADAGVTVGTGMEITVHWTEDSVVARVLVDDKPATGAEILLDSSTSDETVEAITDDAGTATFPKPAPGWIGIRALVVDDAIGELDGQAYGSTRSYATLTVEVTE